VISRNEHDGSVGQRLAESLELPEGEDDGEVGRPNGVEQVSGDNHRVGLGGNDAVDSGPEGPSDIEFALIDACRGLPVVLPDTQVGVCYVGQFHGWRMGLKAVKSKKLRGGLASRQVNA
jgi:hypothetical protein